MRSSRRAGEPPLIALVLATVVLAGTLVSCQGHSRPTVPGSSPGNGPTISYGRGNAQTNRQLRATTWRVMTITRKGKTTDIPSSLDATLNFGSDATFRANDTVNDTYGRYQVTTDKLTFSSVGTSLVGYGGADPTRTALIKTLGDLINDNATVSIRTTGSTLTLSSATNKVTFTS